MEGDLFNQSIADEGYAHSGTGDVVGCKLLVQFKPDVRGNVMAGQDFHRPFSGIIIRLKHDIRLPAEPLQGNRRNAAVQEGTVMNHFKRNLVPGCFPVYVKGCRHCQKQVFRSVDTAVKGSLVQLAVINHKVDSAVLQQ